MHPLTKALNDAGVMLSIVSRPSSLTADKDGWQYFAWTVGLVCEGRGIQAPYLMGPDHVTRGRLGSKPIPPSREDVVASLCMVGTACDESFDDWCSTYAYDTDSRRALETYLACQESGTKIRRLLGKHFRVVSECACEW